MDLGTGHINIGFPGEDKPRISFPALVALPAVAIGIDYREPNEENVYVGESAEYFKYGSWSEKITPHYLYKRNKD
jgi:actin-related protein